MPTIKDHKQSINFLKILTTIANSKLKSVNQNKSKKTEVKHALLSFKTNILTNIILRGKVLRRASRFGGWGGGDIMGRCLAVLREMILLKLDTHNFPRIYSILKIVSQAQSENIF